MRVFVTGATGFVGRWLQPELEAAGHELVSSSTARSEITDFEALRSALRSARPDAVVHLAAVSFAPDATTDPSRAMRVNVSGTDALLRAIASLDRPPATLVVSSSEVYGRPAPDALPLTEAAALEPYSIYGLTKVAQEAAAVWTALRHGIRLVVVRPFNHTGPGQRSAFAVPAFVQRVRAVRTGEATTIRVGNTNVRRDIGDVRDVVHAYRLLLERMEAGWPDAPRTLNVATGRSVAIGEVIETLCRLAGVPPRLQVDPDLVRPDEPVEIVGDASAMTRAVGWIPRIALETTLTDMLRDAEATDR